MAGFGDVDGAEHMIAACSQNRFEFDGNEKFVIDDESHQRRIRTLHYTPQTIAAAPLPPDAGAIWPRMTGLWVQQMLGRYSSGSVVKSSG